MTSVAAKIRSSDFFDRSEIQIPIETTASLWDFVVTGFKSAWKGDLHRDSFFDIKSNEAHFAGQNNDS
jgi:hypothetical protein